MVAVGLLPEARIAWRPEKGLTTTKAEMAMMEVAMAVEMSDN